MTIDFLAARARRSPDLPALVFEDQAWTYADLNRQVSAACARLASAGVRAGVRAACLLPNRPEAVVLAHALLRLGAVMVPLNLRLTPLEIEEQVSLARPGFLVADPELGDRLPHFSGGPRRIDWTPVDPDAEADAWAGPGWDPEGDWAILFTSGTSGAPRGAVLTVGNLAAAAAASEARLGVRPGDRWLLAMPLYHVGGLSILFRAAISGMGVVLRDRFEETGFMAGLERDRVTLVSLVPTMLRRLLGGRDRGLPAGVRLVLVGGAACPEDVALAALDAGWPLALTYGLTEAGSQVATALPETVRRKPGSVGRPLEGMQLRIAIKPCGRPPRPGEPGEIFISGPAVMRGYLGEPDLEGPLATGDIGYLDEEGDLFVLQRRSDLILTGGENVYPAEVERALRQHPQVREACVVGLPDAEWGQQVAAVVEVQAGTIDPDELEVFLRERLAGFKIPRAYRFTSTLPTTASGKISRPEVMALFKGKKPPIPTRGGGS